jgi:hypothetical protein
MLLDLFAASVSEENPSCFRAFPILVLETHLSFDLFQ